MSIFALSAAGFAFQVALTRIFSLIFQYHFVFLAVSLAVLGLGLGALGGYALQHLRLSPTSPLPSPPLTLHPSPVWSDLSRIALALVVAFPLIAWRLSRLSSASIVVAALLALVPFVLIGAFNAYAYSRFAAHSAAMYGADLVGAGAGLLAVVGLLAWGGAFNAILALSIPAALAALALALVNRDGRAVAAAVIGLALAASLTPWNQHHGWIELAPARIAGVPPDKTMIHILRDPASEARVIATQWTPFARVDVVETNDPTTRFVFIDGGAGSIMYAFNGDLKQQTRLTRGIEFLPFTIGPTDRTLILGAGAGRDVLLAKLGASQKITAVEINPAVVNVTRQMAAYNGNILDLPGVETVTADGRTYIERDNSEYDLVYLNVVYSQAATPGTSALTESYIFTVEAFRAYWRHLSPGGRLAVVTHNAIEGIRVLMTAVRALEEEGYTTREALDRAVLLMRRGGHPTTWSSVIVVQRKPWTKEAATRLDNIARSLGFQALYIPIVFEDLINPLAKGRLSLDEFVATEELYNYFPTTDNRPFFYHLDKGTPPPLTNLLTWVVGATILYALFVLLRRRRQRATGLMFMVYFAFLGTAFLLAEVPLIQGFILLLGNPTLALISVVGGLLLGAGLGSLFSGRFVLPTLPRVAGLAALVAGGLLAGSVVVYPALTEVLLPDPPNVRILGTVSMVLPLGFVMGIPFPSGLRLAGAADTGGVAAYWGLNAVTSVLGSTLATVIALNSGFQNAVLLAVALYVGAAAVAGLGLRRVV